LSPTHTHTLNIFLRIFSAKVFNVFILGQQKGKKINILALQTGIAIVNELNGNHRKITITKQIFKSY